jgi:hypothetical protein
MKIKGSHLGLSQSKKLLDFLLPVSHPERRQNLSVLPERFPSSAASNEKARFIPK